MAEKKEEDFTQHSEYKKIDELLSMIFAKHAAYLKLDKRKILFSKQIQDWKKQKKTDTEPSDGELKQFICKDLRQRYKEAITEIKKKYPSAKYQKGNDKTDDETENLIQINYQHNNKMMCAVDVFSAYGGNIITMKPKSLRFAKKNNNIFTSKIYKRFDEGKKEFVIQDIFPSHINFVDSNNKEDFKTQTHLHNVQLYFKLKENKICLKSYFNTTTLDMVKVNKIEFTLNEGNITEIKQSYANGTQQDPPITITDENEINNKIKEIFGDKNNTAIQNIINELDNKQRTLITNGHPELLNGEDKKNALPNEEKPKEEEAEKEDNTNIITKDINKEGRSENNASCNCCGLDLSCLKSCTNVSFVEK